MSASVCWTEIYKSFVGSSTEAKRNRMFAPFQRTNSRQSAVSLLQFSYDLVFSTMRDRVSSDLYELPASTSTARTFYAPLNERSSFDALRFAARLIGKNVRRRQFIISAKLHREAGTRRGVASEPLCVPSERSAPRIVEQ